MEEDSILNLEFGLGLKVSALPCLEGTDAGRPRRGLYSTAPTYAARTHKATVVFARGPKAARGSEGDRPTIPGRISMPNHHDRRGQDIRGRPYSAWGRARHNELMWESASNARRLQEMIRKTIAAIDQSRQLMARADLLIKQSRALTTHRVFRAKTQQSRTRA
jgi:hypothetical protein